MDEKNFVSYEVFKKYHELLMEYIGIHDDLILNGETICPKCGEIMTSDKCENCLKEE